MSCKSRLDVEALQASFAQVLDLQGMMGERWISPTSSTTDLSAMTLSKIAPTTMDGRSGRAERLVDLAHKGIALIEHCLADAEILRFSPKSIG